MDYFVIGPVYYLSYEESIEIKNDLMKVNIVRNHPVISELLKDPFMLNQIGSIEMDTLKSNSIHFSMNRVLDKELDSQYYFSPMIALQKYLTQSFFFSLWLIKDNSVNTGDFNWWHYDSGEFYIDKPAILFSNAKGEYVETAYSLEEIEQAKLWQEKLAVYMNGASKEFKESDLSTRIIHRKGINNHNKRNLEVNENRIMRSIRFIHLARGQSFLPAKIASYISAIEALISSNRESLVMQVAERVPKVIGGSFEEKKSNHDKLRAAYGVRNKYVHGDKVTTKVANNLVQVSEDIDSIARALLIKMIDEYDDTKDYGEQKMTKWYEQNFMF